MYKEGWQEMLAGGILPCKEMRWQTWISLVVSSNVCLKYPQIAAKIMWSRTTPGMTNDSSRGKVEPNFALAVILLSTIWMLLGY